MLKVIFTLDYEIHGNGEGCPRELMVEPTQRLLRLFDEFGAKLTIMADIAEILKFREYAQKNGCDDYHYEDIAEQLRTAVRAGHDVQLHVHSSFFKARCEAGRWVQDWSEYNLATLSPERLDEVIRTGKEFLVSLLRPVKADYECMAFRAANWSMSPSPNIVAALIANEIKIDTSVFKYGRREGLVNFDYSAAHHHFVPWRVSPEDICRQDEQSPLWEYPIYCERRGVGAFATPNRIYRALLSRLHPVKDLDSSSIPAQMPAQRRGNAVGRKLSFLTRKHPWKADFNQCSGRQLIKALLRTERECASMKGDLPFVLIGHSKLFNGVNERSLRPFLAYVAAQNGRFGFARFADVHQQSAEALKC